MGEEEKLHRDPQLHLVEQTNDFPATESLPENAVWEARRSLERERSLLQSMIDGARNYPLVYLDRDFNFVHVNEAYAKTCRYRPNEMVGKNHFDLYPHEENEAIFVGVRDSGIAVEFHDKPFIFPDQPERGITYWDWTLSPVKNASGDVEGLVFSLFETTERKRAEEALRESEKRFNRLFEDDLTGDFLCTPEGKIILCNPAFATIFGFSSPREAVGTSMLELYVQPEERDSMLKALKRHRKLQGYEAWRKRRDGEPIHIVENLVGRFTDRGELYEIHGYIFDDTERKQAEEALKESEANLARAQSISHLANWEMEVRTEKVRGSAELYRMFNVEAGCTMDTYTEKFHPDDRAYVVESINAALYDRKPYRIDYRIIPRTGDVRHVHAEGEVTYDEKGLPTKFFGTVQDITKRKRTEEAWLAKEAELQLVADATPVLLTRISRDLRYVFVNHACAKWLGRRPEEIIGKPIVEIMGQEALETIRPYFERVLQGERVEYEAEIPYEEPGPRFMHVTYVPERNGQGEVMGWLASILDITEHKRTEEALRRLNETLEQQVAERTELAENRTNQLKRMISELTLAEQRERRRLAVLIHDHIQQMLVGAKIGLELMTKRLGGADQKKSQEICDLVVECLKTARSLNTQLSPTILYERGLGSALKWLSETMQEAYGLDVKTHIDSDADVEREDIKVLVFESVRELLFNVVKHAGVASARVEMSLDDRDGLRITVKDHGVGFDPERTLRDLGGNHFGLFSIRERLELIGGNLQIESTPGHGAAFSLVVPTDGILSPKEASKEMHETLPPQATATSTQTVAKIRVLLVDDHVVMREGLSSLLREHADIEIAGEAADGEEAVQLARTLQPAVILMDISMPRMNGIDATRIIHSELPHIRTIGLSMYDDDETEKGMRDAGAIAFMNKGAHSDELVDAIRKSIGHVR